MCSCDDDYHGNRDIGSLGLWETERFCEKKLIVRASEREPLNKELSNYKRSLQNGWNYVISNGLWRKKGYNRFEILWQRVS